MTFPTPQSQPQQPQGSWPPPATPAYPAAPAPAAVDPRRLPSHLRPALSVEERDYVGFWRAPRYRWWKSLLALFMAGFLFLFASMVLQLIGIAIDGQNAADMLTPGKFKVGPGFFIMNNISLALAIPFSMWAAWACVQQRPKWLTSVTGGMRWGWFAVCLAWFLPLWGGFLMVESLLGGLPEDLGVKPWTAIMIAGILLTTPLQAAGEEYLVRGLVTRAIGAWIPVPAVAFVVSAAVGAAIFMSLHGAGDPWLNAYYLTFGFVGAWMAWRTGGLEAPIMLHIVNNVISMVFLPFTDFSDMFNREAGTGGSFMLVNMAGLLIMAALVEFLARRKGITTRTAPGRRQWDALMAPVPAPGMPTGTPGWGAPAPAQPQEPYGQVDPRQGPANGQD